MTSALQIQPQVFEPETGIQKASVLAEAMTGVLADTYRLTFKSHAYHWNVQGPLFYSLHKLTEAHYEDLFKAADTLAERIRAMGQMAPMTLAAMLDACSIRDATGCPSAGEMCEDLASDHERLAQRLHSLISLAAQNNDPVTEDLATTRSAFHEKAAWMLRAIATEK